jgi:hypothetical protein
VERLDLVKRLDEFLREIFYLKIFLEHMCIVVLGVTNTRVQETKRFLGARKLAMILVG